MKTNCTHFHKRQIKCTYKIYHANRKIKIFDSITNFSTKVGDDSFYKSIMKKKILLKVIRFTILVKMAIVFYKALT